MALPIGLHHSNTRLLSVRPEGMISAREAGQRALGVFVTLAVAAVPSMALLTVAGYGPIPGYIAAGLSGALLLSYAARGRIPAQWDKRRTLGLGIGLLVLATGIVVMRHLQTQPVPDAWYHSSWALFGGSAFFLTYYGCTLRRERMQAVGANIHDETVNDAVIAATVADATPRGAGGGHADDTRSDAAIAAAVAAGDRTVAPSIRPQTGPVDRLGGVEPHFPAQSQQRPQTGGAPTAAAYVDDRAEAERLQALEDARAAANMQPVSVLQQRPLGRALTASIPVDDEATARALQDQEFGGGGAPLDDAEIARRAQAAELLAGGLMLRSLGQRQPTAGRGAIPAQAAAMLAAGIMAQQGLVMPGVGRHRAAGDYVMSDNDPRIKQVLDDSQAEGSKTPITEAHQTYFIALRDFYAQAYRRLLEIAAASRAEREADEPQQTLESWQAQTDLIMKPWVVLRIALLLQLEQRRIDPGSRAGVPEFIKSVKAEVDTAATRAQGRIFRAIGGKTTQYKHEVILGPTQMQAHDRRYEAAEAQNHLPVLIRAMIFEGLPAGAPKPLQDLYTGISNFIEFNWLQAGNEFNAAAFGGDHLTRIHAQVQADYQAQNLNWCQDPLLRSLMAPSAAWLQREQGIAWLSSPDARNFFSSPEGVEWFDSPVAAAFINSDAGANWLYNFGLSTEAGITFLRSPKGTAWLSGARGRAWNNELARAWRTANHREGQGWLSEAEGRRWLASPMGLAWLSTSIGITWLGKAGGGDYLLTQEGRDFLATDAAKPFLKSEAGQRWLGSDDSRLFLRSPNGHIWLRTMDGATWLRTPAGRAWSNTFDGFDSKIAIYGAEILDVLQENQNLFFLYLLSPNGAKFLVTNTGQDWLATPHSNPFFGEGNRDTLAQDPTRIYFYLTTPNGQLFLASRDGQEWLSTPASWPFLNSRFGHNWLRNSDAGNTWLATPDGTSWLDSYDGQAFLESLTAAQTTASQSKTESSPAPAPAKRINPAVEAALRRAQADKDKATALTVPLPDEPSEDPT